MSKIDWTKPLELEDGTPVRVSCGDDNDGYRLVRSDGKRFTPAQTNLGNLSTAWYKADGTRLYGQESLRVRNVPPVPACAGGGWVYYDGTNRPPNNIKCEVILRCQADEGFWPNRGASLCADGWVWSIGDGVHPGDILYFRVRNVPPPPPQRAIEAAVDRLNKAYGSPLSWSATLDARHPTVLAIARIIAEYEKLDTPDLIEAREIVARVNEDHKVGCPSFASEVRNAEQDHHCEVWIALEGIKRGRELAAG